MKYWYNCPLVHIGINGWQMSWCCRVVAAAGLVTVSIPPVTASAATAASLCQDSLSQDSLSREHGLAQRTGEDSAESLL